MEGVLPALTSQTEVALALIIPQVSKRIKEWVYADFSFDFIFASISHFAVDGMNFQSFFPLIFLAILAVSYYCYHKLNVDSTLAQ